MNLIISIDNQKVGVFIFIFQLLINHQNIFVFLHIFIKLLVVLNY